MIFFLIEMNVACAEKASTLPCRKIQYFPGECLRDNDCKKGAYCLKDLRRCVSKASEMYRLIAEAENGRLPVYLPPKGKGLGQMNSFYCPTSQSSTTKSAKTKKSQKNIKEKNFFIETAIGIRFTATTSNRGCRESSGLFGNSLDATLLWKLGKLRLGLIISVAFTSSSVCTPKGNLFRGVYLVPISPGFILKAPLLKGIFNINFVGKTSFDLGFNIFDPSGLPETLKYPSIQPVIRTYLGFEFFLKDIPVGFGYYVGVTIIPDPFLIGLGINVLVFFL